MPYRDEERALLERRDQLLARLREARTEERSAEGAKEFAAQEARVEEKQGGKLPMLDNVRIASPCNVAWDSMRGDNRKRFCGQCNKSVYNLSEMTRDEAESFLGSQEVAPCVRLYMRTDGTVLTSDCPTQRKRRAMLATAGGFAGVMIAFAGWFGFARTRAVQGEMVPLHPRMGAVVPVMGSAASMAPQPPQPQELDTPAVKP